MQCLIVKIIKEQEDGRLLSELTEIKAPIVSDLLIANILF